MDATNLAEYVGAPETDAAYVEQCWDEATSLVSAYIGTIDPVIAVPIATNAIPAAIARGACANVRAFLIANAVIPA